MTNARLGVASRAFSLAAILGLAIAFSNFVALQETLVMLVLAGLAVYVDYATPDRTPAIIAVEATFASAIVVITLPNSVLMLPYLVVLPLVAGTAHGIVGSAWVVGGELTSVIILTLALGGFPLLEARSELLAPWTLTIIGAGLLGAWSRKGNPYTADEEGNQVYVSARRLLGQLRGLTRRLSSGLDPQHIALDLISEVDQVLPDRAWSVFVMTEGGVFFSLADKGMQFADSYEQVDALLQECWLAKHQLAEESRTDNSMTVAFPIRVGDNMVGVLVGSGPRDFPSAGVRHVQRILDRLALRLDTAVAFDEIRLAVTTDERQRLAREIHDGVAQEIAALGYTIDDIAHSTEDEVVLGKLRDMRSDVSRVVTELRLSIFDLRSQVSQTSGLGAALSDYLQNLGAKSAITVHLTMDEAPTRLPPGVETELFRIAQEAITNVRKHSGANNLWVDCCVRPPYGRIAVRDDGLGFGRARDDSYGLRIMRERAERIRATLTLDTPEMSSERPGTCITVTVHG